MKKLFEPLSESLVNIDEKKRSNLFSWKGQFSPQLVEHILTNYADSNNVIFDPFLGSGTLLYESLLLKLKAYGCEINPAALAFAKIYELKNKSKIVSSIKIIDEIIISKLAINPNNIKLKSLINTLLKMYKGNDLTISCILSALITALDLGTKILTVEKFNKKWSTLKDILISLPHSKRNVCCYNCDARKTPLKENTIDFVLTSPPYINVFNYHQNYRKSVESLGFKVLDIAKSEIGSNRKFRMNRFLTVVQYCMDMIQVFIELRRVCKSTAKLVFVVGRISKIRKTPFNNSQLIQDVAKVTGFKLVGKQDRTFKNRYGNSIVEEILKFEIKHKIIDKNEIIEQGRKIGKKALKSSLSYADESVHLEILSAIELADNISTSSILSNN